MFDPETREIDEPIVTVAMPKRAAERLSYALSDFCCWASGFIAGCPDSSDRHPLGVGVAREFNIALKDAIDRTEKVDR